MVMGIEYITTVDTNGIAKITMCTPTHAIHRGVATTGTPTGTTVMAFNGIDRIGMAMDVNSMTDSGAENTLHFS